MTTPKNVTNGEIIRSSDAFPAISREVALLRQMQRVYELEYVNHQKFAAQLDQLKSSRYYPMALLVVKITNVLERGIRRRLGRRSIPPVASVPLQDEPSIDDPLGLEHAIEEIATREQSGEHATPAPIGPWGHRLRLVKRGMAMFIHALKVLVTGGRRRHSPRLEANNYISWVETYRNYTEHERLHLLSRLPALTHQPLISVVMATYNSNADYLKHAINSVLAQAYENFELVIADDCSTDPAVRELVERYAKKDRRVRLIACTTNGGISAATNAAIAAAQGEFIAFMDHDDMLVGYALFAVILAINATPDATILYSDEDKINDASELFMPYFKSDFDPLLLLGQNYVCHLTTIRRDLIAHVGGLRSAFDGAQDWDLVLRVSEVVPRETIVHIPHVLYHWRSHPASTSQTSAAKPWALTAGVRAVTDALERRGIAAEVRTLEPIGFADVHFALPPSPPLVSILIPTRDGVYLERCIRSVLADTTYPNYEIVVIDNGSQKPSTLAFFEEMKDIIRVVRDDSPFNYSALHNRAVPECRGDVLCLLNDDTTVITPDWLTAMVAQLLQPGIGLVGAKLFYPDGRIQHAGVIMGVDALAAHVGRLEDGNSPGYFSRMMLASEFQACTAACIVVRRSTWEQLEGLDEKFRVAFNDIDFCLRVQRTGLKVTYTPHAQLVHYESVSRGLDTEGEKLLRFWKEVAMLRERWGLELAHDPYHNPNLAIHHGMFNLAYPPRTSPWYTGIE